MDKRKVIAAYRRGIITIQECAQILGMDTVQIAGLLDDPQMAAEPQAIRSRQPVGG
ncbi:hypothetical protein [Paenibacillus darwinianus]|uniref:hypothetical protein n=1 Tax=Paenibacillus darwinianus TaxID=1380763 RepID=UPI000A4C6538|nr:hypothetical protein [Paenibacillus darwinianus]